MNRQACMEAGRALALLAVYMLALLVPLHQAAATQRDLATLGYEAIGNWSICSALTAADGSGQKTPAVKCPLQALGKPLLDTPPVATPAVFGAPAAVAFQPLALARSAPLSIHARGPRAPPIPV